MRKSKSKMTRLTAIVMAGAMVLGLSACGGKTQAAQRLRPEMQALLPRQRERRLRRRDQPARQQARR